MMDHDCRPCDRCGRPHAMCIENMETGEIIPIDTCNDCLFKNSSVEWGGTARCITSDGRNVNMAEELNRLEAELFSKFDHCYKEKVKE